MILSFLGRTAPRPSCTAPRPLRLPLRIAVMGVFKHINRRNVTIRELYALLLQLEFDGLINIDDVDFRQY